MQTSIRQYAIFFLLLISLSTCVEDFVPEADNYQDLLVVSGQISNELPPYNIRLSKSDNISNAWAKPVLGASVTIVDDLGKTEKFFPDNNGNYKSTINGMQGKIGRSYQLKITTPDGETYESSFEQIRAPLKIDAINVKETTFISEETYETIEGLQFFSNCTFNNLDTNFYLIDVSEVYEYDAAFKIYHYYDGQVRSFPTPSKYFTCWKYTHINQIFTFHNELNLDNQTSYRIPIHFVSTRHKELTKRYSPSLRQLTINENAYKYYSAIETLLSEKSNLYAKQPYQIRGNVTCTSNKELQVLGYFLGAGISHKRDFITRPDLNFEEENCEIEQEEMRFLRFTRPQFYPVYLGVNDLLQIGVPNSKSCLDCRVLGGTTTKPDFW